ncbi:hypothetical protein EAE32_02230 [Kocuria tytonicola]|uniref:Uncharacterized protein n=1 Tax=Kocuria tytonicola TaxID=2055946 RepID=A0A3L9LC93_9MICC|nr:hypothetical protein [Kocuria tytonicola]RLY94072.1 hypothetical protein EAE32_02230 [Kocuria tytonicola]
MGHGHSFYHRACDVAAGEDIVGITVAGDGRVALEYGEFPENLRCNWAGFLYDLSLTPAMLDDLYPDLRVVSARLHEGYGHVVVSGGTARREYRREITPVDRGPAALEVVPFDPTVEPQSISHFWDGSSPSGFIEELRGNFPDGEPLGPYLSSV